MEMGLSFVPFRSLSPFRLNPYLSLASTMGAKHCLSLLIAALITLASRSLVRGELNATQNPFLSIKPSKDLKWHCCYEDTPASKLGDISCARLLVGSLLAYSLKDRC